MKKKTSEIEDDAKNQSEIQEDEDVTDCLVIPLWNP